MNKLSLLLAALTLGLTTLTPATAGAHEFSCGTPRTRVTTDSRGCSVHWEFRFSGLDCNRRPIFRWVVVRTCAPAPRPHCGTPDYGHGHSDSGRGSSASGHGRSDSGRDRDDSGRGRPDSGRGSSSSSDRRR